MKLILVAFALVAAAVAAPPVANDAAQIVRSEFNPSPEGGYVFSFETDNGIQRQETGEKKTILDEEKKPHDVVVVRGQVSYVDADGTVQNYEYFADETGYHTSGPTNPKRR